MNSIADRVAKSIAGRRRVCVIVAVLLVAVLVPMGSAYAYYQMTNGQALSASTDIEDTDAIVKEVASFSDLFEYSQDEAWNDSSSVSAARYVLKLTEDVTLPDDLVVTADVHLDLNGHTLNLNDHVLTFKHGYSGCYSLYSSATDKGIIEKGSEGNGYIAIDLVNAAIETDNLAYYSSGMVQTDSSSYIRIVNMDPKYTAYSALYLAANSILSDLGDRVEFKGFAEVSGDAFDISAQANYIPSKICSFTDATSPTEVCSFAYKDIDLPYHYLSSDVRIDYESSDTSYISNGGKVMKLPDASDGYEKDITLTATVSCDAWGTTTYSTTFKIHLVNLADAATNKKVGDQLFRNYIQPYYHDGSITVVQGKTLVGYYYEFDHTMQLPLSALDGSITYAYKTYDFPGTNEVETDSTVDASNTVLNFVPNNACYHLGISVNGGAYDKLQMYSVYVGTLESAARMILNAVYGGTVLYDKSATYVDLSTLAEMQEIETAKKYIEDYSVTGVSYQIKEGSAAAEYFTVSSSGDSYSVTLDQSKKDDVPAKSGYMTITFTFASGATASIDMYIGCYDINGNTTSGFLPYYSEFDAMISNELTTTIDLPFCYESSAPYVCYDFAYKTETKEATVDGETFDYYDNLQFGMPDSFHMSLYYDGRTQLTFTNYSSQTSMTAQLDAFLTSKGLTLSDLAKKSDVKYVLTLDAQNATADNKDMLVIYNYKFSEGDSWNKYQYSVTDPDTEVVTDYMSELTVSNFTVKGGLFYNTTSTATNAIHDANFFIWIYNNFNPNGDTISSASSTDFIPTDWLGQDVAMDVTADSTLGSVTDFTGIQNLKHVTKVNLSGVTITSTILSGIAQMTAVTDLNLSGCDLTSLDTISTMTSVKTLDISNNSIQYFDKLVDMTALETVYLYSNNASNAYYGSSGICNSQAFVDLMRNGVAVYNSVSNSIPISYKESDSMDDYKRLSAIIYQDKLSKNVDITKLYSAFSGLTATSFNLDNTGGTFTWGYESGKTVYTATYFYVNYVFSGYTLNVKYYVDRY